MLTSNQRAWRSSTMALACSLGILAATKVFAADPVSTDASASSTKKECFFNNQINGWNWIDDKTVRVSVGANRSFDLTLFSTASGLRFSETIGVYSSPSPVICEGNGLGVSVYVHDFGLQTYPVTKVALAPTKAEEKAKNALEKADPTTEPKTPK